MYWSSEKSMCITFHWKCNTVEKLKFIMISHNNYLVQVFFFASSWPWTVLEKTQKDWNSIRAPIFRQIVEKLFPSSNVAKLNWKAYLYNIGTFLVLYNFWKLSKGQNCFRQNTHQKMRNILTSKTNEKKSCQMQQSIQSVF